MHIRHLRELAVKIRESLRMKTVNANLMRYFTDKITLLCKTILRDCCIEITSSPEEVERAVSSENHANYLQVYQKISQDTASKYQQICSSSEESITQNFLAIVPQLIQDVKAIFRDEMIPDVQSGLRGLPKNTLEQKESQLRDDQKAFQLTEIKPKRQKIRQLVCEVCNILEELCMNNRDSQQPPDLIRKWGESLGIWSMVEFLKPFFQKSPEDVCLHKRLELFSRSTREIMSDVADVCNQDLMLGFFDVTFSLIHFAKFDPAKVVRFELTDSTNSPVTCGSEARIEYNCDNDTFSQLFYFPKEEEGELLLRVVARVPVKGQIHQIGAFQSVITVPVTEKKTFDRCLETWKTQFAVSDIAVEKVGVEDSQNIQVVVCSTQKVNLLALQDYLQKEPKLQDVDWKGSQVAPCPLTVRTEVHRKPKTVLRLRLIYKWKSEAVFLDSEDFVAQADPFVESAAVPEVRVKGTLILLWLNMLSIYIAKQTYFIVK